ncbi:MAG: hypothetical protein R6W96_01340 [Clostridia bacterium]
MMHLQANALHAARKGLEQAFPECREEDVRGFILDIKNGKPVLTAGSVREFIAGTGAWLRICNRGVPEDLSLQEAPVYPVHHYMPGHFGNSFEAASRREMEHILEDLALAGSTGYLDWFDPNDMPDPYHPHVFCSKSMDLWRKKKDFLIYAKSLGLETGICIAHNAVFTDQLRREWLGKRSKARQVQGQVLCPSIPEARKVCLDNQRNLFRDFKASGVAIDKVMMGPYDDGGCACEKCQPYYPVFLSMAKEILDIALEYFPDIRLDILGWWTSKDEMEQLHGFYRDNREHFGFFQYSPPYHDAYAVPPDIQQKISPVPLSSFVHVSYSDTRWDVYYKYGVHVAGNRLDALLSSFDQAGCREINTYNEGFCDHLNQFIITRLSRDRTTDVHGILQDYCMETFSLGMEHANRLVDILKKMQFEAWDKAPGWESTLLELQPFVTTPPRQAWAFAHILLKARLMALDGQITQGGTWKTRQEMEPFMGLIRKRQKTHEALMRDVYGLGVMAHAFVDKLMLPAWQDTYEKLVGILPGGIIAGSVMHEEA